MDLNNKVAVVTGGANGIGKAVAEEFSRHGARVAIIDLSSNAGNCELYFCGDIAEEKNLQEFSRQVINTFGKIDFLINNAYHNNKGILSGCSFSDFSYVLNVGVTAPYVLAKLFMNYFNDAGAIVNISSTRAYMSQEDTESYTAAKGGISALTHALAVSLAGKVRVNSISPGWIDTSYSQFSNEDKEQHPVKRIGTPEDIAKLTIFLCSEDSGFITGQDIIADGGMSRLMIYNDDYGWKYNKLY
ncbi:MAG: SDR family oxidoreductase [Peptococcaceae bacterium]|nr:SDR family oxidoreductase [Peptococcaceae bacterium]